MSHQASFSVGCYCADEARCHRSVLRALLKPSSRRPRAHVAFDPQPVLKGTLLELRPLQPEDFGPLFAVASDPLVWEQHPEPERHQEGVFREFFREAIESGGALVAFERESGRIIGSSRFHAYDPIAREVEVGWTFLGRQYWGGRYNREMKRLMLEHAFQWVDQVLFIVGSDNRRSQRAVEKIGAVRLRIQVDARGRECVVYGITRASFAGDVRTKLMSDGAA